MATVVRNTDPYITVWASAFNALKAQVGAGASFHLDACEMSVTAATATDLPTALVLTNNLIDIMTFHFADTLAHKVADATALPARGAAVDLASAITAANLIRTSWATHIAATTKHYTADATNTLASVASTDLASLLTLANEEKTKFNAHMLSAPAAASLRVVPA